MVRHAPSLWEPFDKLPLQLWRGRSFAKNAQDFGRRLPREGRALTPSKRLKLSPAGPMVLHAPSLWEPFDKLPLQLWRGRSFAKNVQDFGRRLPRAKDARSRLLSASS
jgi:hypothetical protein